jgi:hypothetical protein
LKHRGAVILNEAKISFGAGTIPVSAITILLYSGGVHWMRPRAREAVWDEAKSSGSFSRRSPNGRK